MKLLQLATAALAFTATAAIATPQYTGTTTADWDIDNYVSPFDDGNAGYYIWNDVDDTSTWYIVWSGDGEGTKVTWSGSINFYDSNLGATTELLFENNDNSATSYDDWTNSFDDSIAWYAFTNGTGGVDGISFTIADNVELMGFSLYSSSWGDLETDLSDSGSASVGIYIGSELSGTNVLVDSSDYQLFEILVPEPATMALFGLGIAGLAASRRRQKKELAA